MSNSVATHLLGASAGPRIRARRRPDQPRMESLLSAAPRTPSDLGIADWTVLLRGAVSPGPATWVDWVSLREFRGTRRQARRRLIELEARLEAGAALRGLRTLLEEVLVLDPGVESARILLACLHLQEDQALSALVQLAPLRDLHPDHGEIVLLAAVAYAQLGRARECHRMLSILDVPDTHPAAPVVARLLREIGHALGLETQSGPPHRGPAGLDLPLGTRGS